MLVGTNHTEMKKRGHDLSLHGLAKVLNKHAHNMDLTDMLTIVNNEVA